MNEVSHRRSARGRVAQVYAAVVLFVCLFGHLGAIGLVGPDEPRYAWIARAMAETGDWITPRLYGQPWFEKPVLYYWAAAVGFLLHLPAEWAARLPSAFAALAAALAIGWLAWKHYDRDASSLSSPALLAPLLFSTSVAAIGFARAAAPDMLFSASITLAMACAACVLRRAGLLRSAEPASLEPQDALEPTLFGVFSGLAVLTKGPAAIVIAGGAIGLWAIATKQWRPAFRLAHPFAIAGVCIIALPWYVVCAARNPDFLHVFLFEHNFERYLTPVFQHRQPFWYFGPIVLLALLPWTALLWPPAQEGLRLWRAKSCTESPGFFFACWAIVPFVFFSFSQSKLPGYILPAVPPLALLCAVSIPRAFRKTRAAATALATGIAATWIILGYAAFHFSHRIISDEVIMSGPTLHFLVIVRNAAVGAVILIAAGLILAGYRQKLEFVVGLCALCVAFNLVGVVPRILAVLDPYLSGRPHADFLRNDRHPDRIFAYHLNRNWTYGLAFYSRRELPEWSPSDPEAALVLTTDAGFKEIKNLGRIGGTLDEPYRGILYVPVQPARR